MTNEAKALVEKLLRFDWRGKVRTATAHQAADLIKTQAREIERLRGVLQYYTDKIMANAPHWERSNDK